MPDKLTDKEIVKALEDLTKCNNNVIDCDHCSLSMFFPRCPEQIGELALDLINRLQAQNERDIKVKVEALYKVNDLKIENERLEKELETEKNQVIRLENQIGRLLSMNQAKLDTIHDLQEENNWYNETLNTTKAEAYKEFADRLKANTREFGSAKGIQREIDNLLKEMVGSNER